MKHQLPMLIMLVTLATSILATTKDLKTIDGNEIETRPAIELNSMIASAPDEKIYIVKAVDQINANLTDYYKWIYDAEKKILVVMTRMSMKGMGDQYMWRIWHDVNPSDFSDRLPYGNEQIKTTASPHGRAAINFPLSYPNNPDVTKWP